ncbi:glycosyltransferase [Streptomyces sp. NPDC001262]|uniref:glycosyltransferase n=1 Tax=Streptomyces TaxID=1883 RepID=UPI00367C87A8
MSATGGRTDHPLRMLFTTQPASGHLRPLVPVAQAARERGHDVAVLAPDCMRAELDSYGLRHVTGGYDWRMEAWRLLPRNYGELTFDEAAEACMATGAPLTQSFAGHIARATARDILDLAATWRPDLIVRELDEMGGYLAAEALEIPHVSIASFGGLDQVTGAALGPILDEGRRELGLAPDPLGTRLYHYLHASFLPEAYGEAELILPNTRTYRHPNAEQRYGRLPEWLADLDHDRPFVFAGFGTVVYALPGSEEFVAEVIDALGELDANAVLAVGSRGDELAYGPVPENVRLVRFIEQSLMLEGADLFITHGGLNSIKEALRPGIPMVALPVLEDHRHNAEQLARIGLSKTVGLREASAASIADACAEVLTTPSYRAKARRLQRHIHAQPSLAQLIDDMELVVREATAPALV